MVIKIGGVQRDIVPLALGQPIGASSIPVGKGIQRGTAFSFVWGVQRG